jgi:methylglutaconyl-CoA hydratase
MNDPTLILSRTDGATAWLTLNRPAKRNALNDELLVELRAALDRAFADTTVRSIVLVGAGVCFCSGRDRGNVGNADSVRAVMQDGSLEASVSLFTEVLNRLLYSPKPTIAAVHGVALAGGQALTLACDFVVAESSAKFGNPEMQFGFPAAMNTVLLAHHLGRRRALEIAVTGASYSAETYLQWGLVNRLAAPGELAATATRFADELNALAPWAVRRTRELLRAAESMGLAQAMVSGDQVNQLLRLNGQLAPLFEAPAAGPKGTN